MINIFLIYTDLGGKDMIKVHVQSEQVRRNIDLFQKVVQHFKNSTEKKAVPTYVNRLTGAMRFSDKAGVEEREWKPLIMQIDLSKHELLVSEGSRDVFTYDDLEPTAYRIMSETFHVLEELAHEVHDLKELAQFELEPAMPSLQSRDCIHEAWHQVDRVGAEELLKEQTAGVYLFRKDTYAHMLERELTLALKTPVKCLTLSYTDDHYQVHDLTLVSFQGRWLIYNDDPNLSGRSYRTISDLLASITPKLMKALLHPVMV
jgi:hypothetical protein